MSETQTRTQTVPVVFDTESGEPLGRYDHTEEDAVIYYDAHGYRHVAPLRLRDHRQLRSDRG